MVVEKLLRFLIVDISLASVGLALWLTWLNLRGFLDGDRWMAFYLMARLGYVVLVGLIAELVYRAPFVTNAWRSWVYLAGLLIAAVGFAGIGVHQKRHGRPMG